MGVLGIVVLLIVLMADPWRRNQRYYQVIGRAKDDGALIMVGHDTLGRLARADTFNFSRWEGWGANTGSLAVVPNSGASIRAQVPGRYFEYVYVITRDGKDSLIFVN